jgi:ADP-ribose pyrophosphatase
VKPDESRVVHEGRVVTLLVERWGDHEREVVDHPGAVVIVATDRDGSLVLVRQLREAVRKELLELPAGTLKPGEEPLACARRELREETGYGGGRWRAGPTFYTAPGFCRELMHLYFAEDVEPGEAALEEDESLEVVVVSAAEIESVLEEAEDAKTLVGLLLHLGAAT